MLKPSLIAFAVCTALAAGSAIAAEKAQPSLSSAKPAEQPSDPRDDFGPEANRRKAELGVPTAQHSVAQGYQFGMGVKRDAVAARLWYRRAAEQGDAWSQEALGQMLAVGDGGARDTAEAIVWLRKAAEARQTRAMLLLAELLRRRSPADDREALRWLRLAAARNESRASFLLAVMLESGQGEAPNVQEAFKWLKQASVEVEGARLHLRDFSGNGEKGVPPALAELVAKNRSLAAGGDREAQFKLGTLLLDGIGTRVDRIAAEAWLRKAAQRGHAGAMYFLAEGDWDKPNAPEASAWLEKSAKLGYMAAQTAWGRHQKFGSAEMSLWYRKAAEQGDADAQYALGSLPFEVGGPTKAEGVTWLRRAAEQGHAQAQSMLGTVLLEGWSGTKDEQAAIGWFRKAADQGEMGAMGRLAGILEHTDPAAALNFRLAAADAGDLNVEDQIAETYAEADGSVADPVKALAWYIKAAQWSPENYEGNNCRKVRTLLAAHPLANYDYVTFARWLEKASGWGYHEAQFDLATLYRDGLGVPRDRAKAIYWFKVAAKGGVFEARDALAAVYAPGGTQDESEAIQVLQDSAKQGSASAAWSLSQRYWAGNGVKQDEKEARRLLERAAAGEVAEAQFELGKRLIDARGFKPDIKRGVELINTAGLKLTDARLYLMDWLQGPGEPKHAPVAYQVLLSAAEKGDAQAQLDLGDRYRLVQPAAINMDEAIRWVTRAAEQGLPAAQFRLYELLNETWWRRNQGSDKPQTGEAAKWLLKAADAGFGPAVSALGEGLQSAKPGTLDVPHVMRLLTQAASNGDAKTRLQLGDLYAHVQGEGQGSLPPLNHDEARRWYLSAAAAGAPEAYIRLASICESPLEALQWQEKALAAGVQSVALPIAEALLAGKGVPPDPQRAIALLEHLAATEDEDSGAQSARERLAAVYELGEAGIPKDLRKAIGYYEQGAAFTNAGPAYKVAEIYRTGPPEIRSDAQALRWYLKGIDYDTEGGDGTESFGGPFAKTYGTLANARMVLAIRLETGDGLSLDLPEALDWFKSAASLEDKYPETAVLADFKVAQLLERGIGKATVRPDATRAADSPLVWYRKGALLLTSSADRHLGILKVGNNDEVEVPDVARRLPAIISDVAKAAQGGDAQAQYDLGRFYLVGLGVPRNAADGIGWLTKAAHHGHIGARAALASRADKDALGPTKRMEALARFHELATLLLTDAKGKTRLDPMALNPIGLTSAYRPIYQRLAALVRPGAKNDEQPNISVFVVGESDELKISSLADYKAIAKQRGLPDSWAYVAHKAAPYLAKAAVAKTEKAKFELTLRAAEIGYPEAQALLAEYYEQGKGTAKKVSAAYTWSCLAAAQGDAEALQGLTQLEAKLTANQIAEAQHRARTWWNASQISRRP
jgi:TPR repeat protein